MIQNRKKRFLHTFQDFLWNAWCVCSVMGVWPRFIEPYLLDETRLFLKVPQLPAALKGVKVVQLSDLHLHPAVPEFFLRKVLKRVCSVQPDIIVFTGDFLCFSKLTEADRLKRFLCSLSAPFGCFAVLGNHDYEVPVSVNSKGEYDITDDSASWVSKSWFRLFSSVTLAKKTTERAKAIGMHPKLIKLLQQTPCQLLENQSKKVPIKGSYLNICGLGEYTLGKFIPSQAFASYDAQYPGIVLTHNPDTIPLLKDYPGDIILSGHTHGGQVNLPWIWKKLTLLENMQYKKGLFHHFNKWEYVSRGIGSVMPFRWFSRPEMVIITLE